MVRYIDGGWQAPSSGTRIEVRSAATEELVGSVSEGAEQDVDDAVAAVRRAFTDPQGWSRGEPARRAEVLERFAQAFEARAAETARRITVQNGMPIGLASNFEGGFPPVLLRSFSGLVTEDPQEETRPGMLGGTSRVIREQTSSPRRCSTTGRSAGWAPASSRRRGDTRRSSTPSATWSRSLAVGDPLNETTQTSFQKWRPRSCP